MSGNTPPQNDQSLSELDRELESATAQFRSGDQAGAVPRFQKLADAGLADAQCCLGFACLEGVGVPADQVAALQWFTKAAEAGDAEAMCWIGYMYQSGKGVPTDIELAREWYLKSASAGDPDAMTKLGGVYFWSLGVTADAEVARSWYRKAAEAGDARGQFNLSAMLAESGEEDEAKHWLQRSAEQGHEPAVRSFREQSAAPLLHDRRYDEALPLLREAVNAGSVWAHYGLGNVHYDDGAHQDFDKALQHYETAHRGGYHTLAHIIGRLHLRAGHPEVALKWFRDDAHEPISSLYWQYRILKNHPHLEDHPGEHRELLAKAADAGHVLAKLVLIHEMLRGPGLRVRLKGVLAWLSLFPYLVRVAANDLKDERLH